MACTCTADGQIQNKILWVLDNLQEGNGETPHMFNPCGDCTQEVQDLVQQRPGMKFIPIEDVLPDV